jgi:hypothetical protein
MALVVHLTVDQVLDLHTVTVALARTPIGDHRYTLMSKDEGETALAKFLGK